MTITGMDPTSLRWTDGQASAPDARLTRVRTDRTSPAEQARLRANVGAVIRRERRARGWLQRDLGAAAGYARNTIAMVEVGGWRPSETLTRRLAVAFGGSPVEVAMLDIRLQRAAGESLRQWRRRPWSVRRQRVYDEAARQLDAETVPDAAVGLACARLAAALAPPWRPPS